MKRFGQRNQRYPASALRSFAACPTLTMPILLFSLNFLLLSSLISSSLSPFSNVTDEHSLLQFKAAITSDPLHSLANWNPNNSFCAWSYVTCSSRGQRVVALQFPNMTLQGSISPFLGNLSFLRSLDLYNNTFHGLIPPQLGRLFRLRQLDLGMNKLEGHIPIPLTDCRNLEWLALASNRLSGSIPPELGFLTHLKRLYLSGNSLTGAVPSFLGNLSALIELELAQNGLEGAIPDELDFGIARLLGANSVYSLTSTHMPKGSIGYIAPEYGFAAPISTKGDIYSFGIVLMEMLTRKRPVDNMFVNGMTLQKWVSSSFSNNILEVVDSSLLSCASDERIDRDDTINCLNQLLSLALLCTNESPQRRPNMREIVGMLEKIKGTFVGTIRTPWLERDISHLLNPNVEIVESHSSST